ncbi:MAG: dephospho-CoA kinase [Solirubrobacterales bacterium]
MSGPAPHGKPAFLGLTGAIAAGKSEALAALEQLGAATLSSDAVVHELLETDRVRDLLAGRWGARVAPDGRLDRARIGEIVFSRPAELEWLEATLHPLVGERIAVWGAQLPAATRIAVVEVPLLFETGMEAHFDATICVVAPEALRAERAETRIAPGLAGRTGRQLSEEEKARRATYVVRNDGSLEHLRDQLAQVIDEFEAGAETRR